MAPAGNANKKMEKDVMAWIEATIIGSVVSVTISQAAPTSCIHVPMLETKEAIQSILKIGYWNALQGESGKTLVCFFLIAKS